MIPACLSPTINTSKSLTHLLNYAATHPHAILRYHASDIILHTHSDASYLTAPKSISHAGGYFMGSTNPYSTHLNGTIHCEATIMCHVMSSVSESEIGDIFINAKIDIPIRNTLKEMGYQKPPSPIQTDNDTSSGFVKSTIKQKHTKTISMRFYWLQDQQELATFNVHWIPK